MAFPCREKQNVPVGTGTHFSTKESIPHLYMMSREILRIRKNSCYSRVFSDIGSRGQPMCWCPLRSSVGFQLCYGAREADFPSEPPQAGVSPRCRNELRPRTNGLGDADAAGALRLLKKLLWHFHGDLTRCVHNGFLYHIQCQH